MSRPREPKQGLRRFFYFAGIIVIAVVWVVAFRSYFRHYDSMHPEITWAVPWVQVDVVKAKGIFLWNEAKLVAPTSGTIRYPKGTGPVKVTTGEVVARVSTGKSTVDVKAPQEGYFLAGLDGAEGQWRYSAIWPGGSELPEAGHVKMMKDGGNTQKGNAVGKIIFQPQDLRFIGYADLSVSLKNELEHNKIMVKMDALDTPSKAHVRVYENFGHRAKIYLNLPWFPPQIVTSRNYELLIEAGEAHGVAIPESAVITRSGNRGTFVLRGSNAVFMPIAGRSISGSRFLVTEGLKLGDAVIVNGSGAKEGRVKLW